MALIKCSECGKKVSDQAPACPHCGNPNIAAPAVPQNPEAAPAPAPKERRSHKKAILVVSIVLVLCLAAGGVWAVTKAPLLIAQRRLQGEWYRPVSKSDRLLLNFEKTGVGQTGTITYQYEHWLKSTHSYTLLSPTELQIDDTLHVIHFSDDGSLLISPAFDEGLIWYSLLTHPTPTPSLP